MISNESKTNKKHPSQKIMSKEHPREVLLPGHNPLSLTMLETLQARVTNQFGG
jgi:hypothetical protein